MVNASDGGGGGSRVFDRLEPLFTEIPDLLGQLAGNEAAWRVFDGEQNRTLSEGWMREPGYFTVPGPYGFETPALYVAMHPSHPDFGSSEVNNAQREGFVQDAVTQVWQDSRASWADSALSTVYRVASQNVWEPDPSAMSGSVSALSALVQFLNAQLRPGAGWTSPDHADAPAWLGDLQQHWPPTAASPESFYAFWNDVNDKCSLYLHAAARLTSSSAQATAAVSDFQTNLLEATEKTRDRVVEALQQWQAWKDSSGAWPTGAMQDNGGVKTILGYASYGAGVVSLWGPAAVIAGPVSVVTGGLSYLIPAQSIEMEALQAATAEAIHQGFMNDLRAIDTNLQQVLTAVRTEPPADGGTTDTQGLGSYAADVQANRRDWRVPEVSW